MHTEGKPDAPATARNRDAILDVLKLELEESGDLLEIGSGTGQHAVFFGQALPGLNWQTSDRPENHAGIRAWLDHASLDNVHPPLDLDVASVADLPNRYNAVFSANTAHIMDISAVRCMFRLVGRCLTDGGTFCLYGPFNVAGNFTSESNRTFDASLRVRDAGMGIRPLEDLQELAAANNLDHVRTYAMPANNMLVVWRRR